MKKIAAVLALLCASLISCMPAYAVQEVTLTDVPPLQPLHNCKHSDGKFEMQRDPCGSDSTEFSSIMQRQADGSTTYLPLGATMENAASYAASTPAPANAPAASTPAAKEEMTPEEKKQIMSDFRKRIAKWLGFALVIAIVAKLLKRSFILWFIVGFVLRMVLVAANVLAF